VHNISDTNKMGETARTVSRTGQKSAHTAMDYALGAQEVNTELLRRTSQAWIEGFRYQARLSQGMAQMFFGQWGNAFKSMPPVERPGQEQSGPVGIEPATNGAQKVTEPAAKDVQKDIEKAEKVAKEKQKAEKVVRETKATEVAAKAEKKKAEKKAEKQRAEKVARETRKAEEAAEETQEATEMAAKSAQKSAEPAAKETQKSTEVAAKDAKDAKETQKSTERAAKDAQKNTETAAFPIEGYDEMNVGEVSERLDGLSEAELKTVGKYEKDNKDRGTLRKEMEQKTETTS